MKTTLNKPLIRLAICLLSTFSTYADSYYRSGYSTGSNVKLKVNKDAVVQLFLNVIPDSTTKGLQDTIKSTKDMTYKFLSLKKGEKTTIETPKDTYYVLKVIPASESIAYNNK